MADRMDFFMVPRRLFADGAFKSERYSKREALLDLIQMASYDDKTVLVNGSQVMIQRGQVLASIRFLSKKWGWSNDRTIRTLSAFESEHFIERHPNAVISTISICNYDMYSGRPNTNNNTPANTSDVGSRTNTNNKEIEYKKEDIHTSDIHGAADRLYALYPSSVVRANGNRVSLKSAKDKEKLERLLRSKTEEELANTIKRYLSENPGAYIKMFSTFLNNLPDYSDDAELEAQPELPLYDQLRQQANKPQTV